MPPNRAIGWYRFILWMMPTCIALTSVFGLGWLSATLGPPYDGLMLFAWLLVNIPTTVGIGFFEVKLRNGDPSLRIEIWPGVIGFFLFQILIIPAMSLAIFFTVPLVAGN